MISFFISLALLIGGFVVYGRFVERIIKVDAKRPTPAKTMADGVDYVELPTWKIYLIQFLNISGLGPIFGAIMGAMYGPVVFYWIVLGTVFGGAVYDYLAGMVSLRSGGASVPEIIGDHLGNGIKQAMLVFSVLLMIMVGSVFVFNPADLLAALTPDWLGRNFWIVVIFGYYLLATMLPIDKVIGKVYPLFGLALLFMALGVMVMLIAHGSDMPEMWTEVYNHQADPEKFPIFPMIFVSVSCGAFSGFHATQSPMMARCLKNEKSGRIAFYGAMVTEGVVTLIWAAAAIAYTKGYAGLHETMKTTSPAVFVNTLTQDWLGRLGGILAVLGVIAAPITTGDTALRSARLIIADFLHIKQKSLTKRLLVTIPLFAVTAWLMLSPFEVIWRYVSCCNQFLSMFTMWAITVWLKRHGMNYWITIFCAMFFSAVCTSYLLYAPEGISALTMHCWGFSVDYTFSVVCGVAVAAACTLVFVRKEIWSPRIRRD